MSGRKIEKAFRLSIVLFVLFLTIAMIMGRPVYAKGKKLKHYYSNVLKVEAINRDAAKGVTIVFFTDPMRIWYRYNTKDNDIYIGDYYSAIMYDNKTPKVFDDQIVSIQYSRIDLF